MTGLGTNAVIPLDEIAAVIFDTDGVVTDTARVHADAWKRVFDVFLRERAARLGERFRPFDVHADYLRYVDGKPRMDGVRSFLASRGIELPEGSESQDADESRDADQHTVRALGSRKDRYFLEQVRRYGVAAYPATVALVRDLRRLGVGTAAVSASRNCAEVLRAAGVAGMFDVRVDGVDAARLGLAGKPDPALFREAARRLKVRAARACVVEDALAGVEAGRRGGFGLVIGVNRGDQAAALHDRGADIVVTDLGEIHLTGRHRESLAAWL